MYQISWCVKNRVILIQLSGQIPPEQLHQVMIDFRRMLMPLEQGSRIHLLIDSTDAIPDTNPNTIEDNRNELFQHMKTGKVDQIIVIHRQSEFFVSTKMTIGEYHNQTRIAASYESAVKYLKLIDASLEDAEWLL